MRVKRLTVRQKSRPWRHWAAAVLFPVMLVVLAVMFAAKPVILAGIAAGTIVGSLLALVALSRTGFEHTDGDYFYTPYAPIGIGIAMLFIARLVYRGYEYFAYGPQDMPQFGSSPMTMVIFGLLAGYYVTYAIGLLRWRAAEKAKA
ncbi:MAG: hypothetical protein V4631_00440 [Pseudomonadota bacterium]